MALDQSHLPAVVFAVNQLQMNTPAYEVASRIERNPDYPRFSPNEIAEIVATAQEARSQAGLAQTGAESLQRIFGRAALGQGRKPTASQLRNYELCGYVPGACKRTDTVGVRVNAFVTYSDGSQRWITVVVNTKGSTRVDQVLDEIRAALVTGQVQYRHGSGQSIVSAEPEFGSILIGGFNTPRTL